MFFYHTRTYQDHKHLLVNIASWHLCTAENTSLVVTNKVSECFVIFQKNDAMRLDPLTSNSRIYSVIVKNVVK